MRLVEGSRTKHIPTASWGTAFDDPNTKTTDERAWVDAQYHHTFGTWEVLGSASFDRYRYEGIYMEDLSGTGIPPFTQNNDEAYGNWLDFTGDASHVFFARHNVTVGTELRQDLEMKQWNYNVQPYAQVSYGPKRARLGHILSGRIFCTERPCSGGRIAQRLAPEVGQHAEPGVRFALPAKGATDIKLNYSWAYREPNGLETLYSSSVNTGGPALNPERTRSLQLEVEHRFRKKYRVTTGAFLNRIDNVIEQQPDPNSAYPLFSNSAPQQNKGLEWEVGADWANGMEAAISQSVQNSRYLNTGAVMTNSPTQLAKANLSIPIWQHKYFAGLEAQYVSRRRTIAQTELGGYLLTNLTLYS